MPLEFTLYTTDHCHLCEQALQLVSAAPALQGHWLTLVDVATDPVLLDRHGTRIPVLAAPQGEELGWPFDAAALEAFVRRALPAG